VTNVLFEVNKYKRIATGNEIRPRLYKAPYQYFTQNTTFTQILPAIMKVIFCMILIVFAIKVSGQAPKTQTPKEQKPAFVPYISKQDRVMIGITFDNWSGLPAGITSNATRSRGFAVMFMDDQMTASKKFGFAYGLGFSSQNVHTNAFFSDSSGKTVITPIPDSLAKKTNKLSLNFLDAAFEFRFHSGINSNGNQWKISAGIKAGVLLQDHVKYEDKNGKVKLYDTPNLNPFQYGITARIGYSIIAVTGYYSLVPVFEKGLSAELMPYSLGVALTL
jgi:hypothetical protein